MDDAKRIRRLTRQLKAERDVSDMLARALQDKMDFDLAWDDLFDRDNRDIRDALKAWHHIRNK